MSNKRIYVVSSNGNDPRLVNAANVTQAIRHVAKDVIEADVANQRDLVSLISAGIKVEEATVNQEQAQLPLEGEEA